MADARIEFKVGPISFLCEGTEAWVSSELGKALERVPELAKLAPATIENGGGVGTVSQRLGPLGAFLKTKNATTNQNRKFLCTALWLHERDKKDRLTTSDVTKVLSDNQQSRLGNASDCLNQNVGKGFCEKDERGFYVTEEGRTEIG